MSISPYFKMTGSEARGLLYGLMESDKIQLRDNPSMPSMRQMVQTGKVVYKRADPEEHWQTYREMVENVQRDGVAYADCEDIACAIAAEDQVRYGVQSLPYAYNPSPSLFHVVVAVPDGQYGALPRGNWPRPQMAPDIMGYVLEDPSAAAGMATFGATRFGALAMGAPVQRRGSGPLRKAGRGIGSVIQSFKTGLESRVGPVPTPASAARQLGELAGEEVSLLSEVIPGLAEDADRAIEEDLENDDDLGDLEGLDEDESFGFELEDWTGSPDFFQDELATRVSDELFGAAHLWREDASYPMGVFRSSVAGPNIDLHEEVGPRSANAPQPFITYGSMGVKAERDDEFGLIDMAIAAAIRGEFKSVQGLNAQLDSQIQKAQSFLDNGDTAGALRMAKKILNTSTILEKKGENPRGRQDVSAWIGFLRHKDEEKLDEALAKKPQQEKKGRGGKRRGLSAKPLDLTKRNTSGSFRRKAPSRGDDLDKLLAELESDSFGSIPAQLRGGAHQLKPVMAAGVDTGTVVPVPLDQDPVLSAGAVDGIEAGFEEFLAELRSLE